MGRDNMDYCEFCGQVEVFDGKICKSCEETIQRNLQAVATGGQILYNMEVSQCANGCLTFSPYSYLS